MLHTVTGNRGTDGSAGSSPINANPRVKPIDKTCAVCQQVATKACALCKQVYYCSKEHQVQHWKLVHREEHLQQADIKAADDAKEKEASSHSQEIDKTCRVCGNTLAQACSGCRTVYYCNQEHQKEDWTARHKAECKDLKAKRENNFAESLGRLDSADKPFKDMGVRLDAYMERMNAVQSREELKDLEEEMKRDLGSELGPVLGSFKKFMVNDLGKQRSPAHPELHRTAKSLNKDLRPAFELFSFAEELVKNHLQN